MPNDPARSLSLHLDELLYGALSLGTGLAGPCVTADVLCSELRYESFNRLLALFGCFYIFSSFICGET